MNKWPIVSALALLCLMVRVIFGRRHDRDNSTDAEMRARIDAHVNAGGQPIDLEVDGGIDRETAPRAIAAGANVLVAGTATFKGGPDSYAENIAAMRGGG